MLPILRLIPVGGVLLAIAILLLALNPPRATSPSARATLMPARGAMIDRAEHPEWRQFLIQAALRRAGEIERLRDLHDTVIRSEPATAIKPEPVPVEAKPEIAEAPPAEAKPEVADAAPVEPKPEAAAPKLADLTPIIDAESDAGEPKPAASEPESVTSEPKSVVAESKVADAAPVDHEPEAAAPKLADLTPIIDAEPKAVERKPVSTESTPAAGNPKPVATEPAVTHAAPVDHEPEAAAQTLADLTPIIDAEPKAVERKPVSTESTPAAGDPKPIATEPAIADAAPMADAPVDVVAEKPESEAPAADAKPATPAAPARDNAAAPALSLETDGSRIGADVAPPATPPAAKTKVATLPTQPIEHDGDDITGSIKPADQDATIPVGIGAASSTEIQVMLPRDRPPALKILDLRRARESKVEQPRRRVRDISRTKKVRRISRARKNEPQGVPPELNFFALFFKAFDPKAKFEPPPRFEPVKPANPYQPNNTWQAR